jgi:CAP-Gly domain-containing linker protein 1
MCPPKCGVFVAAAKLSAPTVGVGATSRPSSVASSRGGRVTPHSSGHITPSHSTRYAPYSNGRVTPASSTSRVLSEAVTPSARPRIKTAMTSLNGNHLKCYVATLWLIYPGIKRSGSQGLEPTSPTRQPTSRTPSVSSPTRFNELITPPMGLTFSTTGSPSLRTPKPGIGGRGSGIGVGLSSTTPTKSRTSFTPKPRIPSAVVMPPPPSPASAASFGRAHTLNDYQSDSESHHDALNTSDLQSNGKAIQDKIANLLSTRKSLPTDIGTTSPVTSTRNHLDGGTMLQDRVVELEAENQRLNILISGLQGEELEHGRRTNSMREDRDQALARVAELEASVKSVERNLHDRDLKIEVLERSLSNASVDTDKARAEGEARVRDLQSLLDDKEALSSSLKESLALKEGAESETHGLIIAKDAEINLLEARVKKAYVELEDERRELGGQVDALRHAGQVCLLSAACSIMC